LNQPKTRGTPTCDNQTAACQPNKNQDEMDRQGVREGGKNARQIACLPHQRFRLPLPLPSSKLFKTINIHFVPRCFQLVVVAFN